MDTPILLTGVAAGIGALMGGASLLVPRWGASVVRLMPDPRWPGGWAEFRALYGGGFLMAHGSVLLTLAMMAQAGRNSVVAAGFAVGALWLGMAIGRAVSMLADGKAYQTRTSYNLFSTGFEIAMGLALWAPWLRHIGG
ncbi:MULTISPECIES: hypothetical protein [Hyphobacterium]|uniref:DUF4345 domain-containing protein n=1 Tax=Hyphobacterium vulgare TaxID=1736751 RepID=A0ABV6ZYJ5_9PROT